MFSEESQCSSYKVSLALYPACIMGNAKANGNIITSHTLKVVLRCQAKRVAPRNKDTVATLTATFPLWKALKRATLQLDLSFTLIWGHLSTPSSSSQWDYSWKVARAGDHAPWPVRFGFFFFFFTTSLFSLPAMLVFICQQGGIMTVL